ncbi:MAG: P-II family nitrogen regulator [Kiritimatiellaeota bacterium]|nr:P-II family nitrogen regulator [Kiritimatiellota bacterium]
MKLILAIIRPARLESVKEALSEVGVTGLTVLDAQGAGRQRGHVEIYRGREYTVNLLRKIELQIAVEDDLLEPAIEAIIKAARSGEDGAIGDGKLFVLEMPEVVRIRTGERGPAAL